MKKSKTNKIYGRWLMLMVIALLCVVALCACGEEHTFSTDWTSDEAGHWHVADCEHTELVSNREAHSFGEAEVVTPATCEANGEKVYTCSVCYYEKHEIIPATGHAYSSIYSSDENGHWYVASCEHTTKTSDKLSHTFGEAVTVTEPSCGSTGLKAYTCSACSYVKEEIIPAQEHVYSEDWDRNENGHWHVASCEHETVLGERQEHSFDSGVTTVKNTCYKAGTKVYTCTVCSYEKSETLAINTHSLGEDGRCVLCGWIQESEGLTFTLNEDQSSYTLSSISSFEGTELSIPAYYNGLPVTAIKNNLFKNKALDTLTIPYTIKGIGSDAFSSSSSTQKNIAIIYYTGTASDWAQIGFSTEKSNPMVQATGAIFMEGSRVRNIELDGIKEIRKYAFDGFTSLKTVTLGESVEIIGEKAFYKSGVTTINFSEEGNVKSIGKMSFYGTALTELIIPSYVETLEEYCFSSISTLKSVDLGQVKEIQNDAFYRCGAIESITIPSTITEIADSVFYYCSGLKGVTIPATVKKFGNNAFYNCSAIEALTYEGTIEQWFAISYGTGECAPVASKSFIVNGTEIKELTIPSSVTSLSAGPLTAMGAIEKITIPSTCKTVEDEALYFCVGVKELIIEEGVESLGEYSLAGMECLKEIVIPESVTKIGYGCFTGCIALEKMTLPFIGNDKTATADDDVKSFGAIFDEYGFGYGTLDEDSLEVEVSEWSFSNFSYTMPRSIKTVVFTGDTLYDGAFGSTKIETIVLTGALTEIPQGAFNNCQKLKNVTMPDTVKTIGYFSFAGSFVLEEIILPKNLETIEDKAFWYCKELKSVVVPASVSYVGIKAFANTDALTQITFENPNGWWYADVADATSGTSVDLSDSTQNLVYLRDVYNVADGETAPERYFKRSE